MRHERLVIVMLVIGMALGYSAVSDGDYGCPLDWWYWVRVAISLAMMLTAAGLILGEQRKVQKRSKK